MKSVREAIQELLDARNGGILTDYDWSLIDAAQPPGEDEIRAALSDLHKQDSLDGHYSVILWDDGTSTIRLKGKPVQDCTNDKDAAASLRAIIPKPEPTWQEYCEIVRAYLCAHGGGKCTGWDDAMDAVARLRKRLEDKE